MKNNNLYQFLLFSCMILQSAQPLLYGYNSNQDNLDLKLKIWDLESQKRQLEWEVQQKSEELQRRDRGSYYEPVHMRIMPSTSKGPMDTINDIFMNYVEEYREWAAAHPEEAKKYEAEQKAKFGKAGDIALSTASFIGNTIYDITKEQSPLSRIGNIAYTGLLAATIPATLILAKKGADVMLEVIKYRLTTPTVTILRPETKYGRLARIKRWWSGYKTPPMIFDQSVKNRLEEIETSTKNIRDHILKGTKKDAKYRNLLLYGKPGTGKTLFATILADKTDMDFLSVSAGDLLQSGAEGKKYFDDLMEMANRSKNGTILFIDEADGLFIDRDTLLRSKALDHLTVLNHILGATGSGSNKFMLIAATNNAYALDPAMGRRFQDRIEMPLPNEATRIELLNLYIKNKFPKTENLLTPEKIQSIATQTNGLSHAEINDMVSAMSAKADTNKDGRLTEKNIDSAVTEAIEKMKAAERDRRELERKTQGITAPTIPTPTDE
jgi:MoxR-like ATPase